MRPKNDLSHHKIFIQSFLLIHIYDFIMIIPNKNEKITTNWQRKKTFWYVCIDKKAPVVANSHQFWLI